MALSRDTIKSRVGLFAVLLGLSAHAEPSQSPVAPPEPAAMDAAERSREPSRVGVTLEEVLRLAKNRAPEMQAARAELTASRAALPGARAPSVLNPYVEVIAERGGRSVTRDVYVTAQLHTPIEIGGQRGRRIEEAESYIDWHASSLSEYEAMLSGAVVRNYGQCVALKARAETLTELLESATIEARTLSARRDAGDATERDAQLAEVERSRIAVQLDETKASLAASYRELSRLTDQPLQSVDTHLLFPQVNLSQAPQQLASRAPAVAAAEAEARYFSRMDARLDREKLPPVSVILQAGRGDYGEARLGAGLAWSLPAFRYNQGERARAQAEGLRARTTASVFRGSIAQRLAAIAEEGLGIRAAVERLDREAIPAAAAATESATRMQRAGKTDLLSVVVARRDLFTLKLRRLEIAERAWALLGGWLELTGQLPK